MSLASRRLPQSGMFSPFLGLNLLGGVAFSCFHYFFALLLHLSLVVDEIRSEEFDG